MLESIAVVIPTLNRLDMTFEAVESCRKQSMPPNEIIVVDNGSEDGTLSADFGAGVQVLLEPSPGAGHARLKGIECSSSSHVVFLDSDDLLLSNALEDLYKVAIATNAEITFGQFQNFSDSPKGRSFGKQVLYPSGSTSMIRRDAFEKFGHFKGDNYSFAIWIEAVRTLGATFSSTSEVVALRRIHDSNMGLSEESRQFYLDLVRGRIENRSK